MTSGKYIMADFTLGGAILDRQELTVDIDRTQDDFIKNLLTIRVERRLGLAVLDAGAIGGGDWEYE
jgi:Phage capsid family.